MKPIIFYVMAKLKNKTKENPRLEQRKLRDGRVSLYLEYYYGRESEPVLDESGEPVMYTSGKMAGTPKFRVKHIRKKVNLNLYLFDPPRNPVEREMNNDTLILAKKILLERQQELLSNEKGYRVQKKANVNFIEFADNYLATYTKKDVRSIKMAVLRFKSFLHDTPEYNVFEKRIKPEQVTNSMILDFAEYLQNRSVGEGAKAIFNRFKKIFKACGVKYGIDFHRPFINSDGRNITVVVDEGGITKDILSPEEARQLMTTHYPGENEEVRRAFLFSLHTGMRFCDVKDLTFGNFDFTNKVFSYDQNKTRGRSKHSNVVLPLTDTLLGLVGDRTNANSNDLVFHLPWHSTCLKVLQKWVKAAGINKHITWHCARHSFGTSMAMAAAENRFSIRLVQEMMGHSNLKMTERYTRVVDEQKRKAMEELSKMMEG